MAAYPPIALSKSASLSNRLFIFIFFLPVSIFIFPFVCFHVEPNRFAIIVETTNRNLHCRKGGRVLVSVPAIPFFREQFLKYARLIFARVHSRDSFKRRSIQQPVEAAVYNDVADCDLVFAFPAFHARFV